MSCQGPYENGFLETRKHVHATGKTQTRLLHRRLRQWKMQEHDIFAWLGNYSRYHCLSAKLYQRTGILHHWSDQQTTLSKLSHTCNKEDLLEKLLLSEGCKSQLHLALGSGSKGCPQLCLHVIQLCVALIFASDTPSCVVTLKSSEAEQTGVREQSEAFDVHVESHVKRQCVSIMLWIL